MSLSKIAYKSELFSLEHSCNIQKGNLSSSGNEFKYNSSILKKDLNALIFKYPFLKLYTIGYSVLDNPIYSVRLGFGSKQVCYLASTHANEYITTTLLMKFLENMCIAYYQNSSISGYNVKNLLNSTTIYLIPLVNPDGVDLLNGNISSTSNSYIYARYIASKYPDIPFPNGWKANIKGVDLNLQFPAGWENAKKIKFAQGYTSPAPRDFVGFGPLTEPEALAVYDFTLAHNFRLILTYHTQGKEIYWQFQDYAPKEAYSIGQKFARVSGYTLANVPYESNFAGYKDWFLQQYRRPGHTIEAGLGENPLPLSQFNQIYNDNIGILILGAVL